MIRTLPAVIKPHRAGFILYDNGTEEVTWTSAILTTDSKMEWIISKETDHLLLYSDLLGGSRGTANAEALWVTDNKVDLTNTDTLYITWEVVGTNGDKQNHEISFIASSTKEGDFETYDARLNHALGNSEMSKTTESLDVSGLAGEYYIRVNFYIWEVYADSELRTYYVGSENPS